ncbi:SDR family NAD(P)-dependent oxidoreductase [Streptomyces sp. NPDC014872]|uniref:type I polyketide synthase n=1 Tax=Streptomyces sp. NPDC014872 TaxID=3364926 RepID=UPI0036F85BFF
MESDLVAIVGMAGRFPQAPDTDALWELLIDGRDAIGPVPPERWDAGDVLDPTREIQSVGGFIDGVDLFDAEFFGISPREAEVLDPQQRLMLETVWRALEDAGEAAGSLRGSRTGVYVGGLWHDYELLRKDAGAGATQHSIVGNSLDIVSSRISYVLGLTGPSLTIESSCSSSLVALHQACQALRHGEVDAALVGGANLMLTPEVTVGLTHFGGLSPTGRCHAFGAGADGFVRGEGVVVVYLKPLSNALRDGDRVRAVVVASAVNNDGGGDSLVTPNPAAQRDLLRRVYGAGTVPVQRLAYVEAHGTGTVRGDTAEAGALGEVLGRAVDGRRLYIGSVKTNIGHLEPAAGLAGVVKSVLALEHGVVPPSLHAEELSADIDFDGLNLAVAREPLALVPGSHIGVNSFGWGGTNAHVVLTGPPGTPEPSPDPAPGSSGPGSGRAPDSSGSGAPFLLPLSAHSAEALEQRNTDIRELIHKGACAREVARTLAWHRDHFPERRALIGPEPAGAVSGRAREVGGVALLFPGQGAQWTGMGAGLYGHDAAFTDAMDRCARALSRHVPWDVRDLVTGRVVPSGVEQVQPASWAMSVSLAAAWADAGVTPDVVVGHSQGEIAAAAVAGALSLEDAALVVSRRSAILRRVAGRGRMLAVDLGPERAAKALEGFEGLVELAVHNGPRSCVLSGDEDSVLLLQEILGADDVFCRLVDVDYGSHSPQIDAIVPAIREALAPVAPRGGHTPLLSTVVLRRLDGTEMDAGYWAANLRGRVRFAEAVGLLLDDGVTHLVEVSPHPGLGTALRQIGEERGEPPVVLGTLRRGEGTHRDLYRAFGEAYVSGLDARGPRPPRRPPVPVPPYPFRRERHWVAPRRGGAATGTGGRLAVSPAPSTAAGVWEDSVEVSVGAHPWLADHRVHDTAVFPAGGHLALAQHSLRGRGDGPLVLRDIALPTALAVGEEPSRLAVTWRPGAGPAGVVSVASRTGGEEDGGGGWTRHFRAVASWGASVPFAAFPDHLLDGKELDADGFYRDCARRNLPYGAAFRSVTGGHLAGDEALVRLELPPGSRSGDMVGALHPVLWDGVLQAALALGEGPSVPVAVDCAAMTATGARRLWVHAARAADRDGFDLAVFGDDREPVGRLTGVVLAEVPGGGGERDDLGRHVYRMVFEPRARRAPHHEGNDPAGAGNAAGSAGPAGAANRAGPAGRVVVRGRAGATAEVLPDALGPEDLGGADTVVFVAPERGWAGLVELTELIRRCLDENPSAGLVVVVREGAESAGLYAGFVAVVQAEYPQFGARLIETDTFSAELVDELSAAEDRVVLRGGERLVGQRVRGGSPRTPAPWRTGGAGQPFRQGIARPGALDSLCRWPLDRSAPGEGRVEVAVDAASLNFIDVMKAMGVYPDDSADRELLGLDCAGVVTAVGPGVTGTAVGDRVVACGFGALASHVTVDARHVVPVPPALGAVEAAALPMVLVTAHYALVEVARTGPGETVLVHSATGGLGLAALQVARRAGATVIATAGTEDKRRRLRDMGVAHVFDSRGLDWAARVREVTGGRGVDVVLNSLSGAALPLGMEVLAEDGRFVEVGKRDIHAGTSVGLGVFKKSISVTAVDIAGLLRRRPERFASLLRTVWGLVEAGELGPLPVRARDFADAEDAMRTMARGEHIGKIVLTAPARSGPVRPQPLPGGRLRAGGTYLITGGLGALGLSLAEFLAASGAGAIALLGRSAPDDPGRIEALRATGTRVGVWSADVADEQRMREVLDEIRTRFPPLRGVFHAAGVLDDATLLGLDAGRIERVLRPKAHGARVLHELTADDGLDLFVLFSSAAAYVGTAGQAAYAAANSALDALALERRRAGLPGLSVQWGPVSGIGLAARSADRGDRLADRGLGGVDVDACWRALRRFIETDEAVVAYAALDPERWRETYPATASQSSWQSLAASDRTVVDTGLRNVPARRRRELVEEVVRRDAAFVLRVDGDKLARDVPLRSLGLDSLMSVELRNRLESSLGLRLSPTLLWKYGSLARLGAALSELFDTSGTSGTSDTEGTAAHG